MDAYKNGLENLFNQIKTENSLDPLWDLGTLLELPPWKGKSRRDEDWRDLLKDARLVIGEEEERIEKFFHYQTIKPAVKPNLDGVFGGNPCIRSKDKSKKPVIFQFSIIICFIYTILYVSYNCRTTYCKK